MTIEPVSSAMTYQAQTQPKIQETEKQDAKSMDAFAGNTEKTVDKTTATVQNSEKYENQGQNNQGNNNNSNPGALQQETIKKAIDKMNQKMYNSEAIFGIHEGTNRVTIKIIDKETREVRKELPPEKTLDMLERIWEMAGILVDEKR